MFYLRGEDKMREEQMTFFNTNHEGGVVLRESQNKAFNQQYEIFQFLKKHPTKSYTPCEIHQLVLPKAPLTSVRLALTNLAKSKTIKKTHHLRKGVYGKYVHTWKFEQGGWK